jgi:hypothetical protein
MRTSRVIGRRSLVIVHVVGISSALLGASILAQTTAFTPASKDLLNAIRAGGLPAAATLVGHYVGGDDGDEKESAGSLFQLAQASDAVIRGSIVSELPSKMTSDNSFIFTDYIIVIKERFQGPLIVGSNVPVRMVGGTIHFTNGTTAEVRGRRVPKMNVGDEYVLFLRQAEPGLFSPTLGPQGIFALGADGKAQSRARPIDPVYAAAHGQLRDEFLHLVRNATIP